MAFKNVYSQTVWYEGVSIENFFPLSFTDEVPVTLCMCFVYKPWLLAESNTILSDRLAKWFHSFTDIFFIQLLMTLYLCRIGISKDKNRTTINIKADIKLSIVKEDNFLDLLQLVVDDGIFRLLSWFKLEHEIDHEVYIHILTPSKEWPCFQWIHPVRNREKVMKRVQKAIVEVVN